MRALWERLEAWFAAHLPQCDPKLRPGASEAQLEAAEAALGVRFPADFRASVRVHDGQDEEPELLWLPGVQGLGSLASIVACWRDDRRYYDAEGMVERLDWLDRSGRVRQVHLHPAHIPFAGSTDWDYDRLLFDFVPAAAGRSGQVILRYDVEHVFFCETFRELLEKTAEGLERGTIRPVERPAVLGGGYELEYLSPRAHKPLSPLRYFARR